METAPNDDTKLRWSDPRLATPCHGCSAPCCRRVVLPHQTPTRWMDLDFLRYVLGFSRMEALIADDGRWSIVVSDTCSKLDQRTNLCTVHGTDAQPRTCVYFNPHHCWYKHAFHAAAPSDVIRIDLARLERLVTLLEFDEQGFIAGWPGFQKVKDLFDSPAVSP